MSRKIFSDPLSLFSHELKTPVSSLRLALDLIKKDQISRKDKRELINLMDQEIRRMTDFINDTLDFRLLQEKGDLMKFQWESWGSLVEQAVLPFKLPAEEKDVRWKVENATGDVEVFMDSLWIRQALGNLISNALKHSPKNSTIFISSRITPSGAFRVSVQDEGEGISLEEQKKLFTAFYRRRTGEAEIVKNTGLGLVIARAIVERHRGIMDLSPAPRRGSLFFFELPKIRREKQTA